MLNYEVETVKKFKYSYSASCFSVIEENHRGGGKENTPPIVLGLSNLIRLK